MKNMRNKEKLVADFIAVAQDLRMLPPGTIHILPIVAKRVCRDFIAEIGPRPDIYHAKLDVFTNHVVHFSNIGPFVVQDASVSLKETTPMAAKKSNKKKAIKKK